MSKHQRKLSNYLLDKSLQLRYVLFVTVLSGLIAGALGYMIYHQRVDASSSIEADLAAQFHSDLDEISNKLDVQDRLLVFKMIGVGVGLVVILSAYLVIMTHKVAGPLYKISMYFDRMREGRLGNVTPLRKGDMLTDFYESFSDMHNSVRKRFQGDADKMTELVDKLKATKDQSDYRGEARSQLNEELDQLSAHLAERKKQLS